MTYDEQERLAYIAGDTEKAALLGVLADMEAAVEAAVEAEEAAYARGYEDGTVA